MKSLHLMPEPAILERRHERRVSDILIYTYSNVIRVKVSLIVAVSDNGVMGKNNDLPWDLPEERAWFRDKTGTNPVIMGRLTAESIRQRRKGNLLPHRHNIVVSGSHTYAPAGADVVPSVEDALNLARKDNPEEAFIIGGRQMYEEAFGMADKLYLTRVHKIIEGREEELVRFPDFNESDWMLIEEQPRESIDATTNESVRYTQMILERKK